MARRSPPTDRVVRILELLASRRQEALTLTEIARDLGLSAATCQSVLHTLCEASYVQRSDVDKRYTLGPGVIRLGNAARSLVPVLALLGAEVDRLADRTGFGCCVVSLAGDRLSVVHRSEPVGGFPVPALTEGPFPFAAPFGAAIAATLGADAVDGWIGRGPLTSGPGRAAAMRAHIEAIRRSGASVWTFATATRVALPQFDGLLRVLSRDPDMPERLREVAQMLEFTGSRGLGIDELDGDQRHDVSLVTSAVEMPGLVGVELQLHVYRDGMRSREVADLALELRRVCERAADSIVGAS